MKSLKDYLYFSKKEYPLRIKIAGEAPSDLNKKLEGILSRFIPKDFKMVTRTPIQNQPLDFPKLRNMEVTIFDVTLDYPVTPTDLQSLIGYSLGITTDRVIVRNPNEPSEQYQEPVKMPDGPRILDPNYSEAPNVPNDELYGDAYNFKMLKALNDNRKSQDRVKTPIADDVIKGSDKIGTTSLLGNHKIK